jgi:hypothetical protein
MEKRPELIKKTKNGLELDAGVLWIMVHYCVFCGGKLDSAIWRDSYGQDGTQKEPD